LQYLLLSILTIISCLIFEHSSFMSKVKLLLHSYKVQFSVMKQNTVSDEVKQKLMLEQIGIQTKQLFLITLTIVLIILPFIVYIGLDHFFMNIGYETFYSIYGLFTSFAAVIFYLTLRSVYVRIFRSRKISS
jgi:hypothetical protein